MTANDRPMVTRKGQASENLSPRYVAASSTAASNRLDMRAERERSMRVQIRLGAEGATAPETLRQKNRSLR